MRVVGVQRRPRPGHSPLRGVGAPLGWVLAADAVQVGDNGDLGEQRLASRPSLLARRTETECEQLGPFHFELQHDRLACKLADIRPSVPRHDMTQVVALDGV